MRLPLSTARISTALQTSIAIVALSVTCLAQSSQLSQELKKNEPNAKSQQSGIVDVALTAEGKLSGWAMDVQGMPLAHAEVHVCGRRGAVLSTRSDQRGRFAFSQVRPGLRTIQCGQQNVPVRIWNAEMAPPAANRALLVVQQQQTLRGQACAACGPSCNGCNACGGGFQGHFGGFFQRILQNPWLIGAGTAAAIAIPLATDDDDSPRLESLQETGNDSQALTVDDDSQNLTVDETDTDGGAGEPDLDGEDAS